MNRQPNILWYCTDQQRFDTIRSLGNPHITTPTLDRLVADGVAFERAYVQSPICTPSRASFLTGRYPASTHAHRNGAARFPSSETLVTKILADAGYDCGLVGKLHLASASGGIEPRTDDGFRFFRYSHHPMPGAPSGTNDYHTWLREQKGVTPEAAWAGADTYLCDGPEAELHQTTWCTEEAIRFIDTPREGPWLLAMNPFDPHPPFDPPAAYRKRYDPEVLPPALFRPGDIVRQQAFGGVCQQASVAIDPEAVPPGAADMSAQAGEAAATRPPAGFNGREVKAAYYAMIELIDDQLGRLLDHLEEIGQLDNTLIVFHSDHGEMLGDHGLLYKGCRFFEGLVHVPMIFAWAGRLRAGLRSPALVELVDIAPTLLDAAGVTRPPGMQGRSLMPIMTGAVDPSRHRDVVVSEYNDALGSAADQKVSHATMSFDGRFKTIVYHGLDLGEIFDLDTDPGEFDNLWATIDPSEKARLLHRHIDAVMATSDAGIQRAGRY